ncbi:hydroxymethylglutaryl-CoA lyase [Rhodovarius crocodyli]|uniref:Hydroxymethylglutaryl-CoA lyase n=1 Tax=Rhodovarius crocodyli TaxID=1979269 RepID=A0A437LZ11_9PROT|nr:hydroxymethylglutaryl-CoA lyase [Rhodovarius crocodyli]RVT90605.1 hydroxymethylglutaryl-CoA lyase [Rhodovarius crocodyli]
MTDLPNRVEITEEGPREGFQIEKGPIPTSDKIALIDALSATGAPRIQVASFVNPKIVPGWADAEDVVAGFTPRPGCEYFALWFNAKGMERAKTYADRLTLYSSITVTASEAFTKKNLNKDHAAQLVFQREHVAAHQAAGVPITRISVQAAFGCNYQGEVTVADAMRVIADAFEVAKDTGCAISKISLADSMGWADPAHIERLVGAVQDKYPELGIALHLHDTRGLGIANAYAGLKMGVRMFDAAVAGLGGCPFAGHPGAPGNIATEELVFLCQEMGIETGYDLEALLEAAALAQRIVGRQLPSNLLKGGSLSKFRRAA